MEFIATTTFGLEATVKRELSKLGFDKLTVSDGRIGFSGGVEAIPKTNLWLRSSDRVLLLMGEFTALTFDELFEKTKALPWGDWIPENGKFTVTGKSLKSTLFSVPDCQAIVKKAVVEKLKTKYKTEWFEETGPEYKIQVALLKDTATLTIDTTGPGLHKRGYREDSVIAPIKETLAHAMLELSYWRKDRILLDPLCGSGTIPIEAALMARNIAPGLNRKFVSESWEQIPREIWKNARKEAYSSILVDFNPEIYGSDIDPKAIELCKANARKAGVDDIIRFEEKPLKEVVLPGDYGCCVTNPPYGERIGDSKLIVEIARDMGSIFRRNKTWSVYTITSDEDFEKYYGKKADQKRKLFNGMIKTDYYQFFGEKPPRGKE